MDLNTIKTTVRFRGKKWSILLRNFLVDVPLLTREADLSRLATWTQLVKNKIKINLFFLKKKFPVVSSNKN